MSTTPAPIPLPVTADPVIDKFIKLKRRYRLFSGNEAATATRALSATREIIQGLIPNVSVNLLVGDSGIGKSPLAYQMALCTAAGIPFLGMGVKQSKVVFADFENNLTDVHNTITRQCRFLGLENVPATFMLWPLSRDPEQDNVEDVIRQLAPDFVVIDSLRAFSPQMETDSKEAVAQIRRLRAIASRHGTAFLLVHHVRKHVFGKTTLEDGQALDWLRRAAGVRALINQTDVRLAVARRDATKSREEGAADLVLSGHYRSRGDVGPFLIRRIWNANGDPVGYDRFSATPELIENDEHRRVFENLADNFTFGDAKQALQRAPEAVNWFVHKLIRLGLARKTGPGKYQKSVCAVEQPLAS